MEDQVRGPKGSECLEGEGPGDGGKRGREVVEYQGGVVVLERIDVCPVVNLHRIVEHGSLGKKSSLMWMNMVGCDFFPADPAGAGEQTVVGVGDRQRASVATVIGVPPVGCGGGWFLGEAHEKCLVEGVTVEVCSGIRVDGLESLPKNFCGFISGVPPSPVGNTVWAW
jgi:hypothetical protein